MGRKRKVSQLINLKELNALMINYLIKIQLCTEKASQWQQTFEELLILIVILYLVKVLAFWV